MTRKIVILKSPEIMIKGFLTMEKQAAMRELHPAIAPIDIKPYSSKNLSEEDALALCDLFLTPGLHYVTCATIHDGRRIMKLFIEQLSCYRTIGYVDHAHALHYKHGLNVYDLFSSCNDRNTLALALDQFFLDSFEYDFLGIISARSGRAKSFNKLFIEKLINNAFNQRIPIICFGV